MLLNLIRRLIRWSSGLLTFLVLGFAGAFMALGVWLIVITL